MKESEQSRYIRWGIPGWMMFISLIGFLAIDVIFSHESEKNEIFLFLQDNFARASSLSAAIAVLLIAAAGIPLGFLIYQFYFYVRWNSPFSRDGFFPPFVVGRWRDLERTMDGMTGKQISEGIPWRKRWISDSRFRKDHGARWRYIENYFIETLQELMRNAGAIDLFARYRYLLDTLHTLGAGAFGIYLGYAGYLLAKVKIHSFSLSVMILLCALSLLPLILLLDVEDRLKRDKRTPWMKEINWSVIYLFFLGVFLYIGSPSPSPLAPLYGLILFRVLVLLVPMLSWLLTSNKNTRKLRFVEVGLLITAAVSATPFSLWARGYLSQAIGLLHGLHTRS